MIEGYDQMKKQVTRFLDALQDGNRDVDLCIDFLLQLIRNVQLRRNTSRQAPPPIAECLTIIRHEKPQLYAFLRHRLRNHRAIGMFFELDLDYQQARHSIYGE